MNTISVPPSSPRSLSMSQAATGSIPASPAARHQVRAGGRRLQRQARSRARGVRVSTAGGGSAEVTPANLKNYSQEQLDQIYARLTAGPIPDGPFNGDLIFPKGEEGDRRLAEIVGGLPGFAVELKLHRIEDLGRLLWKGKVFYRNERLFRNRIEDLALLKPVIEGDLSTIQKITVKGKDQWLLFPARLYCGQSLLDSRRESIIIDYFFTDELPGYRQRPDYLAGRNGLKVRDEIRMVRPGLYLGRAYVGKVFLINFFLHNEDVAKRDGPESRRRAR